MMRHDARDKFCGQCGGPLGPRLIDPETGAVLVEVEVHAVPDDVIQLSNERDVTVSVSLRKADLLERGGDEAPYTEHAFIPGEEALIVPYDRNGDMLADGFWRHKKR